jgi:hypothetical protein
MKAQEISTQKPKMETIELQGGGQKRIFKGHTLHWREDSDHECGVFLTAKGAVAFWHRVYRANPEESEEFEVYQDLTDLFQEQDWLGNRRYKCMKADICQENAQRTGNTNVEWMDI